MFLQSQIAQSFTCSWNVVCQVWLSVMIKKLMKPIFLSAQFSQRHCGYKLKPLTSGGLKLLCDEKNDSKSISSHLSQCLKDAITLTITTFSILTLSIKTLNIIGLLMTLIVTTFSIMTPSIMTLYIMGLFVTLSINDTQHKRHSA